MKKCVSEILQRGFVGATFGPIVLAVIYLCIGRFSAVETVELAKAGREIISISAMAFIAAGLTALYQFDRIPIFTAALIHGVALYADYILFYLLNGWLKEKAADIAVFTAIFVAGYALVWLVIYVVTRYKVKELNSRL